MGINCLVLKAHGSAKDNEIRNSIIQCIKFKEENINDKIKASLS